MNESRGGSRPKRRGVAFERDTRLALEACGYCVVRAAASLGPIDLVALPDAGGERILLVQCKRDGRMGREEWNCLLRIATRGRAIPLLAMREARTLVFRRLVGYRDRHDRSDWQPFFPERVDNDNRS